MAFGTGTHPTTQLVLEMLEKYTPAGGDVLDVGSGSGILSIAAIKLGARRAFGVDIEAEAQAFAGRNAALNGVSGQVAFETGSLEAIRAGDFPVRQAPLVLANIIAPVLVRLLEAGLAALIAPGGVLILSGILEEQLPGMLAKLQQQNLQVIEQKMIEDWVALVVQPIDP
jgi:ribosomal protein L11 methyltransferase